MSATPGRRPGTFGRVFPKVTRHVARQLAAVAIAMAVFGGGCAGGAPATPELRAGRDVYADRCSACHGSRGQGGVGPALDEVLTTWPSCDDHRRWVTIGSERWKTEVGPTYGATGKPIELVMPAMADLLSEREIALVAAFERVEYGGGDAAAVLADCDVAP